MIKYENDCVGCGLPCLGRSCRYRNVKVLYCDDCGWESDELYETDEGELCEDCLKKRGIDYEEENFKRISIC